MEFDPNGVGLNNGNFIGLPFKEKDAQLILLPIPWDVTTSYRSGTSKGPSNLLQASYQLDLYDLDYPDAWKQGIFYKDDTKDILQINEDYRSKAEAVIEALENGQKVADSPKLQQLTAEINAIGEKLNTFVYQKCQELLQNGKKIGLIGGDHSVPLGYYTALAEVHSDFGILQIDAHCDLRKAYEGFTYSHASIMYNALTINAITRIVQVGIRDCCVEEIERINNSAGRIRTFFDQGIREQLLQGISYHTIVAQIVAALPQKVHISLDIDGLDPQLCPNTGTAVPGGLKWEELLYLLKQVKLSGRQIIGFDLCEVAGEGEWDGNVGARLAYKLCNLMSV